MTNIRTNFSVPIEPWATAKSRFIADLTPAEIRTFEDATLENLFYDASAAQKRHVSESRSWIMQERITSFVDGIEDYGKALDVFANTSSLILCPLWGSIRVVIQVSPAKFNVEHETDRMQIAGEAGRFQEKIVDMLAQIGEVIPRYRIYEMLYGKHARFLLALSEAYLDVLKFCTQTKAYFKRAKKSLSTCSIDFATVTQDSHHDSSALHRLEKQLENFPSEFRSHNDSIPETPKSSRKRSKPVAPDRSSKIT